LHPVLTFEQLVPPAWSHDKWAQKPLRMIYITQICSVQIRAWIKKKSHQTFKDKNHFIWASKTISSDLQKHHFIWASKTWFQIRAWCEYCMMRSCMEKK
jgi:hypothetical protein